jgi:Family of unknown function (DUF6152)
MTTRVPLLLVFLVFAGITPLGAHHSFSAEFDVKKPFKLSGVVTKVSWANPHIFIYMDVVDEKTGKTVNWAMEMANPNRLMREGWSRDTLKVGNRITVEGSLARNGTPLGNARSVVLADTGQRLFAGSSENN